MRTIGMMMMLLVHGFAVGAQTGRLDSLLNEVLGNDMEMMKDPDPSSFYCYLYGGAAGNDKTFFGESDSGSNIYGINGNIYLLHSKGFYMGASGLWFNRPDEGSTTVIATAGYLRALNRKKSLTFRASYNRYFHNRPDSVTSHSYKNSLGTGLTLKNKWIGGRLSLNFLFDKEFAISVIPDVFSRITLVRFGKRNKLQLEPEISLFIGSETITYLDVGNQGITPPDPRQSNTIKNVYGLLNTQFFLPVCLYLGDFDLELGYSLNLPGTRDETISYPPASFFTLSLGYLLPLH